MRTVLTTCPFCACGCGLYLQAENGKPMGVAPSENHPVSLSRLCARGWGAHEAAAWGERLTRPMVRQGSALEPVSWEEALDFAVERLSAGRAAGRGVGVLGSARATNEENFLAAKLARAALGTNNVDFCLHTAFHALTEGIESVLGGCPQPATLADVEKCDVILLWEGDLARSHPRAAFAVMMAVKKGARLVTFGCVRTQMSHFASLHLSVPPGSEGEVIDGLIAAVIGAGVAEQESVRQRCEGYEALSERVSSARLTDQVRQAAEWYAKASRAAILMAPTMGDSTQALNDAGALASLAAVSGHIGRPGSVLMPLLARSNMRGACEMGVVPNALPGHQSLDDEQARKRVEGAWGRPIPSGRGLDAEKMMEAVKALIVVADGPPSVLPSGRAAVEAMEKMECVVVLDAFATKSAQAAHVVLPIAGPVESDGTYTSFEGRVQRVRPCTDAPGDARAGWQVLMELGGRLGLPMSYGSSAEVMREIAQVVPSYAGMSHQAMDRGWGLMVSAGPNGKKAALQAAAPAQHTSAEYPQVLAVEGVFDWGSDPLVSFGPTLSRDYAARRKLFPGGLVEMSKEDADTLGLRQGWQVRLTSAHGEAVLPVSLRSDLERGTLLVPYGFREQAGGVLGGRWMAAVKAERA